MSLVNDALRKARQEAAEREALSRGMLPPKTVREPGLIHLGTGLILGVGIALAAAVAGGAAAWWFLGSSGLEIPPEQQEISRATSPAEVLEGGGGDDVAAGDTGDKVGDPEAAIAPHPGEDPSAASPEPTAETLGPQAGGVIVDGTESRPSGRPAESPGAVGSAPVEDAADKKPGVSVSDPRDVVAEARLGDTVLTLGYLIFREDDPFAEINGIDVHVGTEIEGFVVEEILRDRVVLSDAAGPLVIRVR